MGLMRKAESRIEDAVGAGSRGARPGQSPSVGSKKKSRLYVHPDELARKLVKEMEAHKEGRSAGASVPDRFTVYLCPDDFERFEFRRGEIEAKLEHHLDRRVRSKKYEVAGDIVVSLVLDPELKLGNFGLLAQRSPAEGPDEAGRAVPVMGAGAAPAAVRVPAPMAEKGLGGTAVIPPREAEEYGLARHTVVLRAGNRALEFSQGRVIVGRAKDVDFRVDDPNVSRRHAAIYWADGSLMVTDLDSTNGTMVNGYPVSNSVLGPHDVITIGECRITVDTR